MPFTISHTVAVIPLFRLRRLDPLALVIGSMAPDFGYFLNLFPMAGTAHSLVGSFTTALPLALLVWCLCRSFADFLMRPLPGRLRSVAGSLLERRPWTCWTPLWIIASFLLGIWSHNLLDAFTHKTGWAVQRLPLLHDPWPLYHILQQLGSVIGLLILAAIYWRRRGHSSSPPLHRDPRLLTLLGIALLGLLIAILPAWNFAERFHGYAFVRAFRYRWIVHIMAFASCGYLILALWLRLRMRRSP